MGEHENKMSRIIIYTDGSYSDKKAGISFLSIFTGTQKRQIAYAPAAAENSTEAELLASIYALKYILKSASCREIIEIRCDEKNIVNFARKRQYKEYQKRNWQNGNGDAIKKSVGLWYELACLLEFIGEDRIKFVKVNSHDCSNKLVDKYSKIARGLDLSGKKQLNIKDCISSKHAVEKHIDFSEVENEVACTINGITLEPWTIPYKNKSIKWYDSSMEDIVLINTEDIVLCEKVHFDCREINLQGHLGRYADGTTTVNPIAVRTLNNGKYGLTMGLTRYIVSKTLSLPKIPCIVTNYNFETMKAAYDIEG
jgi:ribonuclease HI